MKCCNCPLNWEGSVWRWVFGFIPHSDNNCTLVGALRVPFCCSCMYCKIKAAAELDEEKSFQDTASKSDIELSRVGWRVFKFYLYSVSFCLQFGGKFSRYLRCGKESVFSESWKFYTQIFGTKWNFENLSTLLHEEESQECSSVLQIYFLHN